MFITSFGEQNITYKCCSNFLIHLCDLTTGERGRQLLTLSATQLLYDFGKVKSSVDTQKAKLIVEQANVLVSIDDIAYQVASAVINIERYQRISQIGEQQVAGIQRILDIANLRANAGISSQADPVQANLTYNRHNRA